ncbi:hypothetical protein BD560DRAFT_428221 [Blakeslea trispora]|nr:hypothetical protein BD560DRAFT_428221 [Blakeslea trispora]
MPFLDYGLYLIGAKLKELSRSLDEFGLPNFEHDWVAALNGGTSFERSGNSLIDEQLDYNVREEKGAYRTNYAVDGGSSAACISGVFLGDTVKHCQTRFWYIQYQH